MTRHRLLRAVVLLAIVASGAGCGVGVDAAPRPLEPMTTVPLQPTPTVVERPDDRSAPCLPGEGLPSESLPTPAPEMEPSTPPSSSPLRAMTEPC